MTHGFKKMDFQLEPVPLFQYNDNLPDLRYNGFHDNNNYMSFLFDNKEDNCIPLPSLPQQNINTSDINVEWSQWPGIDNERYKLMEVFNERIVKNGPIPFKFKSKSNNRRFNDHVKVKGYILGVNWTIPSKLFFTYYVTSVGKCMDWGELQCLIKSKLPNSDKKFKIHQHRMIYMETENDFMALNVLFTKKLRQENEEETFQALVKKFLNCICSVKHIPWSSVPHLPRQYTVDYGPKNSSLILSRKKRFSEDHLVNIFTEKVKKQTEILEKFHLQKQQLREEEKRIDILQNLVISKKRKLDICIEAYKKKKSTHQANICSLSSKETKNQKNQNL